VAKERPTKLVIPIALAGIVVFFLGLLVGEAYLVIGGAIVGSLGVLVKFGNWFKPPKRASSPQTSNKTEPQK